MISDHPPAEVRAWEYGEGSVCMYQRWRTDERGIIHVTREDGAEFTPTLSGSNAAGMDRVEAQWGRLIEPMSKRWSIPAEWIESMVWRESGGDADIVSFDGGYGLMQITNAGLKAGYTNEELKDPSTNLNIGCRYIAKHLIPLVEAKTGQKADFPRISAAFNAGGVYPSGANEWNLRCTGSHVDAEVAAVNYLLLKQLAFEGKVIASLFDLRPLAEESTGLTDRSDVT